ncbi:hypothetical protein ACFFQW_39680 [Umezawaea endophytica]|uniref:Uncharacterized protein n=1 Tax=Umezawaea endophytica TaxID=1654476 RepID=A0A9X3A5H1_9PSEU|nr:hypothetical protein [Umezawaea endophytica]MCS7482233.1 hypothetical protein [Umezawaea endophytica]
MLISAGFVVGFGVLAVGTANADEDHSSGLLGGLSQVVTPVADQLAPVTNGVSRTLSPVTGQLAPVVSGVTAVAEPVLEPVTTAVRPLTEPLRPVVDQLAPTVDDVTRVVAPVLEPLAPVTEPLLAPVVQVTEEVLPVATPVLAPVTEPLLVGRADAPVAPVAPVVPVTSVPSVPSPTPAPTEVAISPAREAWAVPAVGLPKTPPAVQAAPASPWYQGDVPALPRDVPFVVQGMTTSASAGGLNAPASAVVPGSPRATPYTGSVGAPADGPARGSWFYDYGLHHPS